MPSPPAQNEVAYALCHLVGGWGCMKEIKMNMQTSLLNANISQKSFLDQVREKISYYGTEEASIRELLAIIVGKNNVQICSQLDCLSVRELMDMTVDDFMEIDGIGKRTAEVLQAAIALAQKLADKSLPEMHTIRSPEDAYEVFKDLRHNQQEHFVVAFLDSKNHVIGKKTIFIGGLNTSLVHPREVFAEAIRRRAASIICAHSHPSGDAQPSSEDREVTKRLIEAGKIIGIEVLDHLVIGDGTYVSLKERGLM